MIGCLRRTPARLLSAALLVCGAVCAADKPAGKNPLKAAAKPAAHFNIPLWEPGKVPFAQGEGPLDTPFLTAFLPPEGKRNGASVIIAPGGSNIMLMYGAEGLDVAERYNQWGVAAFVLTYRLSPRYAENVRVAEGQRAVRLIRSRAAEWKLDPNRIGYAGFSAGSNTGRTVAGTAPAADPNAADPIDRASSKPDYLVLVYGAGRASPNEALKDFPPTFLVCAAADRGASLGSAQLFLDLTRAGAVAEIHVYQKGRHGFGSGFGSPEFGEWMDTLQHFLQIGGFLPVDK